MRQAGRGMGGKKDDQNEQEENYLNLKNFESRLVAERKSINKTEEEEE